MLWNLDHIQPRPEIVVPGDTHADLGATAAELADRESEIGQTGADVAALHPGDDRDHDPDHEGHQRTEHPAPRVGWVHQDHDHDSADQGRDTAAERETKCEPPGAPTAALAHAECSDVTNIRGV